MAGASNNLHRLSSACGRCFIVFCFGIIHPDWVQNITHEISPPQVDDKRCKENDINSKSTQCHCEGSTPAAAATDECCRSREHEEGDLEEKGAESAAEEGKGAEVGEVRNVELGVEEVIERRMGFLCIWGALAR